jgi:hypothetical protein
MSSVFVVMDHPKRNLRDQTFCIFYYSLKSVSLARQNAFNELSIR